MTKISPFKAKFVDNDVEASFSADWAKSLGRKDSYNLVFIISLFCLYSAIDFTSIANWPAIISLRAALFIGVVITIYFAHKKNSFEIMPFLSFFSMTMACLIVILAILVENNPTNNYDRGIPHIILLSSIILRVPFRKWMAALLTICTLFVLVSYQVYPKDALISSVLFMLSISVICAYGVYNREINLRKTFALTMNVHQANTELEKQNDYISSLAESKKSMVNILGHLCKTPLHQISGFSSVLQSEAKNTGNKTLIDYANSISDSAIRLAKFIQRTLRYNEIPETITQKEFARTPLKRLLNETILDCKEMQPAQLDIDVEDEAILVPRALLAQALNEITENIKIHAPDTHHIHLYAHVEGTQFVIKVLTDTLTMSQSEFEENTIPFYEIKSYIHVGEVLPMGLRTISKIAKILKGQFALHQEHELSGFKLSFPIEIDLAEDEIQMRIA